MYQRPSHRGEQYSDSIPLNDSTDFEFNGPSRRNNSSSPYNEWNQSRTTIPETSYRGFTPVDSHTYSNNDRYQNNVDSYNSYNKNPFNESLTSIDQQQYPGGVSGIGVAQQNDGPRSDREPMMMDDNYYEPSRPPKQPTVSQRVARGRVGRFKINWKKLPYFCYLMSIIQVAVFLAELGKMGTLTGSPIQTKPSFNPMIGPSTYVMINMGSRFTPCMHAIPGITDQQILFPCPNSTATSTNVCPLSELCGMGGLSNPPNQWWRFITPIFIHAGFLHIGFNLLLQLTLGCDLEKNIGIIRFFIVYFASGIAGFILGGNFSPDGISSTGASGALFGVISIDLLGLLFNWPMYKHPWRELLVHFLSIVISFVLGLLPGLDNFSHIGGFAMGLLTGTALLRSPLLIRARIVDVVRSEEYDDGTGLMQTRQSTERHIKAARFHWRHPMKHFTNRPKVWYAWLAVRAAAVALAIVYFVTLIRQFENGGGHCSWCKYLSCLPVNGWCDQGDITTSSSTSSS